MNKRFAGVAMSCALSVLLLTVVSAVAQTSQPPDAGKEPLYLDPSQPVDARVNDLISRMTLEEKASQLVNGSRPIPRLGIPAYNWWSEALHGVANAGIATVFPEPIGLGATFDTPLIHSMAVVISTEARAKNEQAVKAGRRDIMEGLDFWSPNVNIFRDPRWGRGQETYGEDPFLTAKMAVAFVTGMQGDNSRYYRVISTPKHFDVHSGPEPTRHEADVPASKHDMEDTYLPAFRAAIVQGKADSIMCAYNRINGEPACANTFLLQHTLRDAWHFQGYVVSDCDAVADIQRGHHFTRTMAEAAAVSVKAGMDNECADFFRPETGDSDYIKFVDAVKQGILPEKDIDTALRRLLTARFKLGMFDPPSMVPYANTPESEIDSAAHRELALQAARESMVLLKNNGILPLKSDVKRIAVVGPLAESVRVLEGNYHGTPSHATTALDGIKKQFSAAQVTFTPGMNFLRTDDLVPTSALTTAKGEPGLTAEYFSGSDFNGQPFVTRVEPAVNLQMFRPDSTTVAPPAGAKNFSVRWTGYLTPDKTGSYQLGLYGSKAELWLDGKVLVNAEMRESHPETTTVNLRKGRRYALKVEYTEGGFGAKLVWLPVIADPIGEAVADAKQADVVVAVVGIDSDLEGEEMKVDIPGFHGGDRTKIDLPQPEQDLIHALKGTGKPLVIVLMNGSALAVNWASENADAILDAWYSGEEGGAAIAETLAGVNNPAGRLPVTFYTGIDQLPPFEDYAMTDRTYRYFTGKPLYPFGYGLSYSKFEYSNLNLSTDTLYAGQPLTVEADVKNISDRDGDEVVEVYLTFPPLPGTPLRALRAFTRVHIPAGQTQHVQFTLGPRDLSMVNLAGTRLVAAGKYGLSVGGGQPGTSAAMVQTNFTITGEDKLPE